jgi:hypothetical protein
MRNLCNESRRGWRCPEQGRHSIVIFARAKHSHGPRSLQRGMTIILAFSALILFSLPRSMAQSCQCMPETRPEQGFFNESHILFDTCGLSVPGTHDCNFAWAWFQGTNPSIDEVMARWYATARWSFLFDTNVVITTVAVPTIPNGGVPVTITWRDIDSISFPLLPGQLRHLESLFGYYTLQVGFWDEDYLHEWCSLSLQAPHNVDSVDQALRKLQRCIGANLEGGLIQQNSAVYQSAMPPLSIQDVYPNPTGGTLWIDVSREIGRSHRITVRTLFGTTLKDVELPLAAFPTGIMQLNLNELRNGAYIVNCNGSSRLILLLK